MPDTGTMSLALGFVFLGATTQRITGMGFSLVCAPALVNALGPLTAVTLANTVGIGMNLTIMLMTLRYLDWRKALVIACGAVLIIPPLSLLLRNAPTAWLQTVIGAIVVVSVSSILLRRQRLQPAPDTTLARIATGVAAGAMGATASLSGPPLAMYAARTGWSGKEFVPTFQMISIIIASLAIATAPSINLPTDIWLKVIAAIAAGLIIGSLVAPRVNSKQVQTATLVISAIGGAVTCIVGIRAL